MRQSIRWVLLLGGVMISVACLSVHGQAPPRRPLNEVLTPLKTALPPAQWAAAPGPWTPAMMRQVAEVLGVSERAEQVLRRWSDGAALVWTSRQNAGCQVSLGVSRFADAAGARAYGGLTLDLQRKQDEWLHQSSGGLTQVLESRVQSIAVPGADEAVRCDKRIQLAPNTPPTCVTTLWLRSGALMAECCWRDAAVDVAWAEKLLGTLKQDQ